MEFIQSMEFIQPMELIPLVIEELNSVFFKSHCLPSPQGK